MTITNVKGYHVALPAAPYTAAVGESPRSGITYRNGSAGWETRPDRRGVFLAEITTDEGLTGYGECPASYGAHGALEMYRAGILGADPANVFEIMNAQIPGRGAAGAIRLALKIPAELSAVEMALWDLMGKAAGLPVMNLMGGRVRKKVAMADSIDCFAIEDCLARIERDLTRGVRTVTVKVGADDRRDVELLRQIRERFGWNLIVRVDACGAWGDVCDASRILRRMEPYNIQYVQDALCRSDGESFRRLREMTGVAMAMGQMFGSGFAPAAARVRLMALLRNGDIDVLAVEPWQVGGLQSFVRLASMCDGAGIDVVTTAVGSSLYQAACLTACIISNTASYAQHIIPVGCDGGVLQDLAAQPLLQARDGYLVPPEQPGFGFSPDIDVLKKYCIKTELVA